MIRSYHSCEIIHRVPFYDLDPMQIVWHGNYFNYFENALYGHRMRPYKLFIIQC